MAKTAVLNKPEVPNVEPTDHSRKGFGAKTILFNDEVHTFEDVASQLVKAVRCTFSQGLSFAFEVHSKGSAVVYSGHLERCEAVAMVLEDILLKVKVER